MDRQTLIAQTYHENYQMYFKYAIKLTRDEESAKDLLQTTIYKALKNSENFVDKNLKGWFYTIIKNNFINEYRREKKREEFVEQNGISTTQEILTSSNRNGAEENFSLELIEQTIDNLSSILTEPFRLYYEGYKYDEISEKLNVPMGTVKTRIRACRIKLIQELRHQYPHRKSTIKNVE